MKVVVDRSLCDGSGNCTAAAPELFLLTGDKKLMILQDTIGADLLAKAAAAVTPCPKRALALIAD